MGARRDASERGYWTGGEGVVRPAPKVDFLGRIIVLGSGWG